MSQTRINCFTICLLILLPAMVSAGEPDPQDNYVDWAIYRGDKKGNQFSELAQINRTNVHELKQVWEYHTGDAGDRTSMYANPIMIDGRVYVSTPSLGAACIDAKTGEEVWFFDSSKYNADQRVLQGRNRGVVYWQGEAGRRIFVFVKNRVYAVDAVTGQLITTFGQGGHIDLRQDLGIDPKRASIECTCPGIVYQDLLIVTSRVPEGYVSTPGHIRAYDAVTGEFRWIFRTIPEPDEFGYDTWEFVEGELYGGANPWGGFTVDEQRGWLFCATGSPTYDFYGGFRRGKNLFGNCVLALDARTGKRIWHYQTVHHDLWDMDNPSAPILVTLTHEGETQDAVVQFTKMGFTFVLDRDTGEPLFPTPEMPVPPSTVPGEEAWPTQPFPLRPPPLNRLALTEADLTRISPAAYEMAKAEFDLYDKGHVFTPPSLKGNLLTPGTLGGTEWHGGSFDPNLNTIYVNSHELPFLFKLREVAEPLNTENLTPMQLGESLYNLACTGCHKKDRRGSLPLIRDLLASEKTEPEMKVIIRAGKGLMPAFSQFSDKELDALVRYVRSEPAATTSETPQPPSLAQTMMAEDAQALVDAALSAGDPARGAQLFYQPHMACNQCHLLDDKENLLGPDLAKLPDGSTNEHLVESVLYPSRKIREAYATSTLLLADGQILKGLIQEQDADLIVVDPASGTRTKVPRDEVEVRKTSELSMMPAGQIDQLADRQQFLDLLRYLIEIRRGGPERARELKPGASELAVQLPQTRVRYLIEGYDPFQGPDGEPAISPPWGTLNAIDLVKGEITWRVPLGEYPALVKKGIRNTGAPSFGGAVATAGGLVFVAGTPDEKLRAFDKNSGQLLWETKLPVASYATPSTFMLDGRQYLVVAAGGGGKNGTKSGDSVIAFALPDIPSSNTQ